MPLTTEPEVSGAILFSRSNLKELGFGVDSMPDTRIIVRGIIAAPAADDPLMATAALAGGATKKNAWAEGSRRAADMESSIISVFFMFVMLLFFPLVEGSGGQRSRIYRGRARCQYSDSPATAAAVSRCPFCCRYCCCMLAGGFPWV